VLSITYVSIFSVNTLTKLMNCSIPCEECPMRELWPNCATQSDISSELAAAHWYYIERLLNVHNEPKDMIKCIRFHYLSAFIHGFKHGVDDVNM